LPTPQDPAPNVLSDTELLAAITRDLRAIYSDVIREPLPEKLAAALDRVEFRSSICDRLNIARAPSQLRWDHAPLRASPSS
jgi:hypothetical protein